MASKWMLPQGIHRKHSASTVALLLRFLNRQEDRRALRRQSPAEGRTVCWLLLAIVLQLVVLLLIPARAQSIGSSRGSTFCPGGFPADENVRSSSSMTTIKVLSLFSGFMQLLGYDWRMPAESALYDSSLHGFVQCLSDTATAACRQVLNDNVC